MCLLDQLLTVYMKSIYSNNDFESLNARARIVTMYKVLTSLISLPRDRLFGFFLAYYTL